MARRSQNWDVLVFLPVRPDNSASQGYIFPYQANSRVAVEEITWLCFGSTQPKSTESDISRHICRAKGRRSGLRPRRCGVWDEFRWDGLRNKRGRDGLCAAVGTRTACGWTSNWLHMQSACRLDGIHTGLGYLILAWSRSMFGEAGPAFSDMQQ